MLRCLVSLLCSWLLVNVALAEQYAFIVGIGGYDEKQLKPLGQYPKNDAIKFRDVLLESGFKPQNIVLMVDDLNALPKTRPAGRYLPEKRKIEQELKLLLPALERDDSLIIGLAGHGVQFKGDSQPYFCPLDAKLDDKDSLISLTWLYDQLKYDAKTKQGCKPRRKLLLVDACRNDPASRLFLDAAKGPGLASVTLPQVTPLPEGVVALFSCAEGQQALQHEPLKHGIFFYHVLEGWKGKADGDKDQKVTLDEVIAYTKSQTQTYARLKLAAKQNPRQKGYFEGIWTLRSLADQRLIVNTLGMKFKLISAGEFVMGSPIGEKYRWSDEKQHRVRLTESFYMGAYEVTQADYEAVMGTNPSCFSKTGSLTKYKDRVAGKDTRQFPVDNVSWYDAVEFCNKLSCKESLTPCYRLASVEREDGRIEKATVSFLNGTGYRLPTEAEWEYACRAGTQTPFSFGSVLDGKQANVAGDYPYGTATKGPYLERTERGGQYGENAFGLFDMHGNVREWCQDAYDSKAYQSRTGVTQNPLSTSGSEYRVLRGGSWTFYGRLARSAYRYGVTPDLCGNYFGFRVVLSVGARTRNP